MFEKLKNNEVAKVIRFVWLYGLGKTYFKVAGRTRRKFPFLCLRHVKICDIGIIGCGQFSFATIGYYISKAFGQRFVDCYDIAPQQQTTFAAFYGINSPSRSVDKLIENPKVKYVYIASNHLSHTDYAIRALQEGKTVYIEKPISVSFEQLRRLIKTVRKGGQAIFAGYNRPFSGAIRDLHAYLRMDKSPITLNCFISGHMIPQDHWYRNPAEGTRICGNMGHWLDLAVHILSWRELPDRWEIQVSYSNPFSRDDDLSVSMSSSRGDLVVIILTARNEPFEGINETINFQDANTICKIDDFRRMTIWQNEKLIRKRYWPKDVGHGPAIFQPFQRGVKRDWNEVVLSSLLMLHIAEMVRNGDRISTFSFGESLGRLDEPGACKDAFKSARN